jgi:hypothetical protein
LPLSPPALVDYKGAYLAIGGEIQRPDPSNWELRNHAARMSVHAYSSLLAGKKLMVKIQMVLLNNNTVVVVRFI